MRTRYIYDSKLGKLVPAAEYYATPTTPMVMDDIEPYKNMIDGRMITSRSQHRELLKQHGCVEIGNEVQHLIKRPDWTNVDPQGRKELIVAQIQAFGGHEQFKKAMQRDIDNWKWNSRDK